MIGKITRNNYRIQKMGIGTIIKNAEMLKFVRDHFKTKTMCKNAIKKIPFVIKDAPNWW